MDMDILNSIKLNEEAMIQRLRHIETLEYRQKNSKEKINSEKKMVTEFLRSILQRKHEIISERINRC
jgi:hypothetical protein